MLAFRKPAEDRAATLRRLLAAPGCLMAPGIADALQARLVQEAGFAMGAVTGFGIAAVRLGYPDTGLISFSEVLDSIRAICDAAPDLPIVADGDTGYGNAVNVRRTVAEFARAGAAVVMIEDQVAPKKCGHTAGKQVVDRAEARMKIRAAVEAARDWGILVKARTDARAVMGLAEALDRVKVFADEGADILFMEAPESVEEMAAFCRAAQGRPTVANMVEGGKTPVLPLDELARIGFKIAVHPAAMLVAGLAAMRSTLAALKAGDLSGAPPRLSFEELKRLVGFPDYDAAQKRYAG
jgi:2-methylisocitrate lyase-like PEP mutase family enzyme